MTKNNVKVIARKGRLSVVLAEHDGKMYLASFGLESTSVGRGNSDANIIFNSEFNEMDFGQRRIYATDEFKVLGTFNSYDAACDFIMAQNEAAGDSVNPSDLVSQRLSARYFTDEKIDELADAFEAADKAKNSLSKLVDVASELIEKVDNFKEVTRASTNKKNNATTEVNLKKLAALVEAINKTDPIKDMVEIGSKYLPKEESVSGKDLLKDFIPKK